MGFFVIIEFLTMKLSFQINYTDPAWLSLTNEQKFVDWQQQINKR